MISIFVPAYNEEKSLANAVEHVIRAGKANKTDLEIIIVDDGSTDQTGKIISDLKKQYSFVRSITNPKNIGVGNSFKKALANARGEKLLIIGGDGDVGENEISMLFKNSEKAEMVFLYYLNKEMRGRFRNILSSLYYIIHVLFYKIYIQYVSGPCIYPVKYLRQIDIQSSRFSIVAELTIKLLHLGCTYYEVGGYMQKGKEGSTSVSLKNFIEVASGFIKLLIDVKIINRQYYNKIPKRIF